MTKRRELKRWENKKGTGATATCCMRVGSCTHNISKVSPLCVFTLGSVSLKSVSDGWDRLGGDGKISLTIMVQQKVAPSLQSMFDDDL